ncbi:MAG: gliding motility-associated C-terminal domain-containing protein [Lewinellaceae bacterium]|nr:gliding motility-associated C-terminal domain-containing protein [Lewinellaceae bacterium]
MVVNWTLPPFVHAIGNSTGEQITVWVDSTFAGVDTLLSATINADILTVATPTGTIDGFCGCSNFSKQFEAEIAVDLVSAVNKIPLQLDCVQPCKTYNGVVYCDPGEYNLSQTGCVTNKLVVTKIPPPVVSAPSIQQNGSDYTVSFNITPSVGSVVTGDQGLLQNGVFVSAPIACGVPYSFEVNTAACSQPVAGAAACFLPPDCTNFNLPAAPGDSCHEAPLLCGNFLDGYCSSTAGLLADQPAYLTSPLPDFENNGWLRFAPCEDSIAIDFQVFDCQTGDELGFFLLSGDCDTMTPLAFVSAADGNTTSMNVGGLTPGEVYYLVIDGFYGAECKFQTHVVSGIGTASPGAATCDCIDGYIDGPDDLCPADIAVYTLIDPVCTITSDPPIGGNGIYCPPPEEVCPAPAKDSVVLHWVIPPFMNFLSDSINVKTITVQVDSSLLGIDTVLMGTVSIYWEHIPLPGDTAVVDTNAFCTCAGIACTPGYTFKNVEVHHDVDYEYGILNCNNPCYFFNGQIYCQPGNYLVSQTNCLTQYLILVDDFFAPNISAGSDQTICYGTDVVLGGNSSSSPLFSYNWSSGGTSPQITVVDNVTVTVLPPIPPHNLPPVTVCEGDCIMLAGDLVCPTSSGLYFTVLVSWLGCDSLVSRFITVQPPSVVDLGVVGTLTCGQPCVTYGGQQYCQPGTYSVTGNCEIQEFQIAEDLSIPTVQLGVVGTLTCGQPCVTFNGQQYCQPGTYSVTGNCEIQEFQIAEDLSIPTVQLGVVGTLTCAQPCVTYGGQQYCQPGTYSVTGNCEIQEFQIAEDLSVPTVQLGVVDTLTCAQPCVTFNGQEYCQPGTYSVTGNCEIQEFQIAEDLSVPTVQLGVVGTLTCAQPCVTYGGQLYCQPGTYSVTGNCEIQEFQIAEDLSVPTVQLGVVGTLTCGQPCVTYGGQQYCQPGTYSVTGNCEIQEFQIAEDLSVPTVQLGVVGTLTCGQPCVTLRPAVLPTGNLFCDRELRDTGIPDCRGFIRTDGTTGRCGQLTGSSSSPRDCQTVGTLTCGQPCVTYGGQQYCQPGTYSVTGNCEIQEFQIAEDLSVPTVQLGVVGTLTCAQPCVTYGGQQYCQPGTYSVTANCEIQEFQIAEDLSVPTVQLGVVGTLTCAQPCVTYGGQQYCQPGTYSVTANCEIQEFEILATVQPTLDLGVDKTIVAGESVELEGQTDAQPDVISWYGNSNLLNDNGLILTVQPVENTLYTLEILDINGCQLEASVWVYVTPVPKNWYAPNVFQPGSTGINAYFTLFSADGVVSEIRNLEIYNRWGELVFVRQHFAPGVPELGWDGYGKGKMLDPAVFVWHAELLLSDGTSAKVKGDVTLVR